MTGSAGLEARQGEPRDESPLVALIAFDRADPSPKVSKVQPSTCRPRKPSTTIPAVIDAELDPGASQGMSSYTHLPSIPAPDTR